MMQEGLLWYDDDPARTLCEKVARAILRYEKKYQRTPTLCCVHPSALLGVTEDLFVRRVKIVAEKLVWPNHFLIGVPFRVERTAIPLPSDEIKPEGHLAPVEDIPANATVND